MTVTDHEFVTALEGKRHLMSGTELRMLDILNGNASPRTETPRHEMASNLQQFVKSQRASRVQVGTGIEVVEFSKTRILRWFRANFSGLIYG